MCNKEDIFDLIVADSEKDFIKTGLNLEGEIVSDILTVLEGFPYVGSLIKLGRIGSNYMDLQFVRKIAKFLQQTENIPNDKKEEFVRSLNTEQRRKMYEYLMHFLYVAESEEKAVIMGFIYHDHILGHINDEMFLRLCSIINKCFVNDLRCLDLYAQPTTDSNYVTDNLYSYGLLTTLVPAYDEQNRGINMDTRYTLNSIGKNLHSILLSKKWFKNPK